jgi:protoporphyrin/coproporphyrin ferrochelatase
VSYDAFLLVSFGGPEGPDDVLPFLRNVTRGRGVPEERLAEVAEHYRHFGGVSPINAQCRELLTAIRAEFTSAGLDLPVYWGNRNWAPYLADTLARMRDDGIRQALAFVTSPYGSYSSCRQYLEDIARARAQVDGAPVIHKIRHYHDHPGHIAPHADAVRAALATLPAHRRATTRLVFTAHSIPTAMAATAGPSGSDNSGPAASATAQRPGAVGRYEAQLREVAALVAEEVSRPAGPVQVPAHEAAPDLPWDLVWQSRSGPPQVPWLEPDISDHLATLAKEGTTGVVVSPIGFISDHLEVVWDLDNEAARVAGQLGLDFARAATPGADPRFVAMIRELVQERVSGTRRRALGHVPTWDFCDPACCPPARPRPATSG